MKTRSPKENSDFNSSPMQVTDFIGRYQRQHAHAPLIIRLRSRRLVVLSGLLTALIQFGIWASLWLLDPIFDKNQKPVNEFHYAGHAAFYSLWTSYILTAYAYMHTRASKYLEELEPLLRPVPDQKTIDALRRAMTTLGTVNWWLSLVGGLVFGIWMAFLYEVPVEPLFGDMLKSPGNYSMVELALPLHSILMYALVSAFVYANIRIGLLYRKLGKCVHINPLDMSSLQPFGKIAVGGLYVILVGLALSPLLWLAEPETFFANIPAILMFWAPAGLAMFGLPISTVRARSAKVLHAEISAVEIAIRGNRAALSATAVAREATSFKLPDLLSWRRELRETSSWPVNLQTLSHLLAHTLVAACISFVSHNLGDRVAKGVDTGISIMRQGIAPTQAK